MNNLIKKTKLNFYILTFVLSILVLIIGLLNHYFFRTFAWDYAAYNFAWYDFAHLKSSFSPVYSLKNMTFFQDHFSFTLILLAPLYWIFSPIFGTYSLIIIQTAFIFCGAIYTYKLVYLKTQKELYSILALLLYFTTYGRWASIIMDVNIEIMLSSLVPAFLYFFEKEKYKISSIIFAFILLGRENMPIWFVFIGLFLILTHKNNKKAIKISTIYILISIIYFVLAFKLFIPLSHQNGPKFSLFNYKILGDEPLSALKNFVLHPIKSFTLLFVNHSGDKAYDYVKTEFYLVYLFSGMIILLAKPKYLIVFVPIIAQKMYNDSPIRWSIELYYAIEIVSVMPALVFMALNEIKFYRSDKNKDLKIKKYLAIAIIAISAIITVYKLNPKHRTINWYGIEKNVFYKSKMYKSDFDVKKVYKELEIIPDTAKVSACTNILPHLAFRPKAYYFPRVDDANYIAIFKDRKNYNYSQDKYSSFVNSYVFSNNWNVIVDDYPLLILKKEPNQQKTTKIFTDCENKTSDNQYFIDSLGHQFEFALMQNNTTSFSGKNSIKLNNANKFGLTITIDSIKIGQHLSISVMRKGQNGSLVCSATDSKIFYQTTNEPIENHDDWQKLQMEIILNKPLIDNKIKIYVYKNDDVDNDVFFDDLEIKIK